LVEAVTSLQAGETLPAHFRDHPLIGNWKSFRECHLAGDLLLIYQSTESELILVRMGSHSELFG
jgi:mRNA interferase YafQ